MNQKHACTKYFSRQIVQHFFRQTLPLLAGQPIVSLWQTSGFGAAKGRQTVDERNHLRLWLSPMRYRGLPVYVGQISRDIGVKFTSKSPTFTTHAIDSDVDEARNYLIQDLIESQKVAKIGLVGGVGATTPANPRFNLTDDPYWTDGLRAVFVLTEEATPILGIDLFD